MVMASVMPVIVIKFLGTVVVRGVSRLMGVLMYVITGHRELLGSNLAP
tara:strand:- start:2717 stop:2860 length:144 start_codon:yes stop_codon:yes gene_type:complete